MQIADQFLRDRELRIKEESCKIDHWANLSVVGIFVGALGLAGTFINGVISDLDQRVQLENELIKEAIKPQLASICRMVVSEQFLFYSTWQSKSAEKERFELIRIFLLNLIFERFLFVLTTLLRNYTKNYKPIT